MTIFQKRAGITLFLMMAAAVPARSGELFYYNIAGSTVASLPLAPVYLGGSEANVTASSLSAVGLSPAWACCQNGTGQLSVSGWSRSVPGGGLNTGVGASAYLQFSITAATATVQLAALDYTWFSTLNSDTFNGPDRLSIYLSFNNFATTDSLLDEVPIPNAPPGTFRGPLFYFEDLSGYSINPGQTLSIRFIAWSDVAFWDAGAGFWNTQSGNVNLNVSGVTVTPEPGSLALLSAGIAAVIFSCKRARFRAAADSGPPKSA
ncbi:MAG: PEP-CTERM sorting domain-containing protein [Acidobacteriota bacterium]